MFDYVLLTVYNVLVIKGKEVKIMTKSEIFVKAHKIAKEIIESVGDYMIAMSFALKQVYKEYADSFIDPNYNQIRLIQSKLIRSGKYSISDIFMNAEDGVREIAHKAGAYYGFNVYAKLLHGREKIAKVFISEKLWDEAC
ncbi:hypothetical protein D1B17_06955 [Companilactobacillus zhachilii]|uniref:Uncharacterized protein n=2 Tax=Companilactobacillus zhachilii TaxID=2304606 RepID=A0A386PTF6_9LACO|nr:hypothetical protein D1B17_06955 [Companilactobacillus zhachilii]